MSIGVLISAILSEYAIPLLGMAGAAIGYFVWRRKQRSEGRREAEDATRKANLESVERQNEAAASVERGKSATAQRMRDGKF